MARPVGAKDCNAPPGIEKGIPIPKGGRPEVYPWAQMEIGDSLFFRNRFHWDVNVMRWRAEKRHGFKFTVRKVPGGVRVWRIK